MENNKTMMFLKRHQKLVVVVVVLLVVVVVIAIIVGTSRDKMIRTYENDDVLSAQLEEEKSAIVDTLNQRFKFMYNQYQIKKVILLDQGNYAVALLDVDSVIYRVAFAKEDGKWSVVGIPAIVLSYDDYPDVPRDVIREANNMEVENDGED